MCLGRTCYVEIVAFYFYLSFFFFLFPEVINIALFRPYFSGKFLIPAPIFLLFCTHSSQYTLLAFYPWAHFSKIYLTPHWRIHSIYFDFLAHLILVSLSCSFCFKLFDSGYCLFIFDSSSSSDSCTLFSLPIFSSVFLKNETYGFCL